MIGLAAANEGDWSKRDAAVTRAVEFLAKNQSPEGAFTPIFTL